MKLNGEKLPKSDVEEIIEEILSGKKYTEKSLMVAKRSIEKTKRRKAISK